MSEIAAVLESAGYDTFLPQRDGVEAFVMNAINSPMSDSLIMGPLNRLIARAVFSLDIFQIVEVCDYFIFNMNGRVPDEGAVVESAVALAMGKPVIVYKNDQRSSLHGFDNPLLLGASYTFSAVDRIQDIPDELQKLIKKISVLGGDQQTIADLPPTVRQAVDFGRKVWTFLGAIQFLKPRNRLLKNAET